MGVRLSVARRDILQLGHPLLWEKSAEVTDVLGDTTKALVADLDDTLMAFHRDNGFGRGIAAPQIGVLKRVIFIRMLDDNLSGPLINPLIVSIDDQRKELWDACFSLPNLMVRVSRSVRIKVAYVDQRGQEQELEAEDDLAELLQHEIDHLDGILAVQRAISMKAFATREEWQRQHAGEV